MIADDDSCSSYDSVSTTDLTISTNNAVTGIVTAIDESCCDTSNAFYR